MLKYEQSHNKGLERRDLFLAMKNQKSNRLSVISCLLFFLSLLSIVGLIEHEPWNTRAYTAAAAWVKENPELTVVERTGKFVRVFHRPGYTDTLRPDTFEALVPKGVELQVETGYQYWLYHPVSQNGAIGTWFDPTPPPEAPRFVTVQHQEYRISPDKIESIYTTRVVRWWVLVVAALVTLILGILLRRF